MNKIRTIISSVLLLSIIPLSISALATGISPSPGNTTKEDCDQCIVDKGVPGNPDATEIYLNGTTVGPGQYVYRDENGKIIAQREEQVDSLFTFDVAVDETHGD